jgi:hypothetical protein
VLHAGADGQRIDPFAIAHDRFHRRRIDAARIILGEGGDARFGDGDAETQSDALGGDDAQLAGPGTKGPKPGEQCRAGELAAAGDDHGEAAIVLVRILGVIGERESSQQFGIDPRRLAHRAATIASGAEVIGASSSASGAAKL